jgi:transcriptional regulator with XRE-family HTH domain
MGKDIRVEFAKRLRELRLKRKWTQEQLAEYADLAYRHVQRLESTNNPPPAKIDTIEKLAKAFKISPAKLLDF